MANDPEARLGTRLGNYLLRDIIGRGGMGVVYLGEHIYIQKRFAIKVMHSYHFDQPDARERFLHEARAASVIEHPNIVGVTDFGEAPDGTIFLVMAHVDGSPLDRVLRAEGILELFRSVVILSQVTRALGAAHAKGIIHRDMKPENIMMQRRPGRREIIRSVADHDGAPDMVEAEGEFDHVTILDFGAAKFFDPRVGARQSGVVVGTPAYMAPETARVGIADGRSDVYAVGAIFYEMLTGVVPFDGDSAIDIMLKQVNEPLTPPSQRNPAVEITPEAERVIMRALEKNPDARYPNMEELHWDLQRCYGSVRFRRTEHVMPPGVGVEALRRPSAVPLTRRKQQTTPPSASTPLEVSAPQVVLGAPKSTRPAEPSGPAPVLLTKKKTSRHATLPFVPLSQRGQPGPAPAPVSPQIETAPPASTDAGEPAYSDDAPTKPNN